MKKVRDDLSRKRMEEYGRYSSSLGAVLAGAAGPDGGSVATDTYNNRLNQTGACNRIVAAKVL